MLKMLELIPKLTSRQKVPPQSVIDEMRQQHKDKATKERKEKQRMMTKTGGVAPKKDKAAKKSKK